MKRLLATLVVGAAAAGFAAPQIGSAALTTPVRATNGEWHVIRVHSRPIEGVSVRSGNDVSADRLTRRGRVVGYASFSNNASGELAVTRVGIALGGGAMVVKARQLPDLVDDRYVVLIGPIRGGAGRFAGVEGRVRFMVDLDGRNDTLRIRWR